MLPTTSVMDRLRESASLKVEELEERMNECEVTSASPGVPAASGALVQAWLRRGQGVTPEAARLAAVALGAGYTTGRATLGRSGATGTIPVDGGSALIDRVQHWDYDALFKAAGENVGQLRQRFSLLVGDALSKGAPPRDARRLAYGLFSAGLGLAVAEAEGDEDGGVRHAL
jgi:hypothetical protein